MVAKKADAGTIEIHTVKQGRIKLRMIGRTPLYFNSMSSKAMRDLLIGGGKKTAAEKKEIKHNPEQEFPSSPARAVGRECGYGPRLGAWWGRRVAAAPSSRSLGRAAAEGEALAADEARPDNCLP